LKQLEFNMQSHEKMVNKKIGEELRLRMLLFIAAIIFSVTVLQPMLWTVFSKKTFVLVA